MNTPNLVTENLTGRTALVTGANTGIGLVTARELARAGARVWLACRSKAKADEAMATILAAVPQANLAFLQLDLASLASVRTAATAFLASGEPLHLLVNNAGLAGMQGLTEDGFEVQFGINYVGPYLFTRLLLDRIQASARDLPAGATRIVHVSSRAHHRSKGIPWDTVRSKTRTTTSIDEYGDSKLANVLFSNALALRLQGAGVTSYALHPGVVASDIWRKIPQPFRWLALQFMLTNDDGARTTLHCATSPAAATESGLYYDNCAPKKPSRHALDAALAETLWQRSAAWVGLAA